MKHQNRKTAFTLVEMLVALAIFAVMLTVVFIPINIATNLTSLGTARAGAQGAAATALVQLRRDIQKALVILPNDSIEGVTTPGIAPYLSNGGFPYRRTDDGQNGCATSPTPVPSGNTSRLDLIMPAEGSTQSTTADAGNGIGVARAPYVVSYYTRRLKTTEPYHPLDNPIVLFRAQMPLRSSAASPNEVNIAVNNRFPCAPTADPVIGNAQVGWVTQNAHNEFNLEAFCKTVTTTDGDLIFGQHTLVMPRESVIIAPRARPDVALPQENNLIPDLSFLLSDRKNAVGEPGSDGKIDTVRIQLSVGQYDREFVNRRSTKESDPALGLQPQVARTLVETVEGFNTQSANPAP